MDDARKRLLVEDILLASGIRLASPLPDDAGREVEFHLAEVRCPPGGPAVGVFEVRLPDSVRHDGWWPLRPAVKARP